MQRVEGIQVQAPAGNGASIGAAATPADSSRGLPLEAEAEARRQERLGRFWERTVVAALTFLVCGAYIALRYDGGEDGWLVALLCKTFVVCMAALLVFAFARAVKSNTRALEARSKVEAKADETTAYEITDQRLATLQAQGLPWDVQKCLRRMMEAAAPAPARFERKSSLVRQLDDELGPERTSEFAELILKYTRTSGPANT
jgi:hypothetical protein